MAPPRLPLAPMAYWSANGPCVNLPFWTLTVSHAVEHDGQLRALRGNLNVFHLPPALGVGTDTVATSTIAPVA